MSFTLWDLVSGYVYEEGKGWVEADITVTDTQKEAFLKIFGNSSPKTRQKLLDFINNPKGKENDVLYSRVVFDDHLPCEYIAGQSYPHEVRMIRKMICS